MSKIDYATKHRIEDVAAKLGVSIEDAKVLYRAAIILHRWYEQECGASNAFSSWCIVRENGKTFKEIHSHASGYVRRVPILDEETKAERDIKKTCKRNGLHYYLQTDPRGGTLYVSREPIAERDYTRAVLVA